MENLEYLESEIASFTEAFCPYGYLDIKTALLRTLSAGFDATWAFDQITVFCDECGLEFSKVDPCYIVMEGILQQARNEIEALSGFDICNDANFYVYGNFMCSSFEGVEEDREQLRSALTGCSWQFDDLSECARYWLVENEVELGSDEVK
ncbi:hypothetical protein [Pedobacter miscanthi]|uniref:Uncharacterized protein n=1 Tax=Pedobacter miscanthi TaxID=2259170 RepID=A0A366LE61_9SPHI|nr:hypothetical protein [Pedobacter miscanthi]RBQ11773.1 hypothetical protein DRW42_00395 [Pedobacter miscanthi]